MGPGDRDRLLASLGAGGTVLVDAPPRCVGRGWDNESWRVGLLPDGRDAVLRVPHRAFAHPLLGREVVVLERLHARGAALPFRVPDPIASLPADHVDGPLVLLDWIEGEPVAEVLAALPAGDPRRRVVGIALAEALAHLHRPAPADHPVSAVRGVPLAALPAPSPATADADGPGTAAWDARWREGLAAPTWDGPALLLHGDPHPANVLLTGTSPADGTARIALVDWGDTTSGDPASDVGALHLTDPSGEAVEHYLRVAGWAREASEVDREALRRRALAWTARSAMAVLGHRPGPGETSHAALAACARTWTDALTP